MNKTAAIIFVNRNKEVLLYLRTNENIKDPVWRLPEGYIQDNGEPSGKLVRGIIEENYISPNSFKFFKTYTEKIENNNVSEIYVFTRELNVDLLKISLLEGQKIMYFSLPEAVKLNTPTVIKKILEDYMKVT